MEKRLIEQKIKEYTKPKAEMIKFSTKDVLATSAATFNSNNYNDDIKEEKKDWLDDYYQTQETRKQEEIQKLTEEIETDIRYGRKNFAELGAFKLKQLGENVDEYQEQIDNMED